MLRFRTKLEIFGDWINIILLFCVAALMLMPFLYIFSVSFVTLEEYLTSEFMLWPKKWDMGSYEYILASGAFARSLGVSAVITVLGTAINMVLTTTMAYGLTRQVTGQRVIMFLILFTLLFAPGMIPTYLIVKETGLLDTIWSLMIPVAIIPFILIVIRTFMQNIPKDLNEAALIDGANELQIFYRVVIPLSKPAIAAFSLFYAVFHWNNYFTAVLYLNRPEIYPVQLVLRQIVIQSDPTGALGEMLLEDPPPPVTIQMAAIILATVPILIVYPFLQKYFAKGVMLGSIKG